MKKLKLLIVSLILVTALTACNKNENKDSTPAVSGKATGSSITSKKNVTTIDSIALYDGTPFYLENEDGKMVYNDECLLGESLKIYVVDGEIEQKEAIRLLSSGKEESFNFVHINYYDNDYWTRDIFITNNKDLIPGIITTDTLTYSAADGTTATSKKLEEGTVVAIDPASKQTDSDLGIDFLSVTYYSGTAFGKTAFVKMDSLSDSPGDIIAKQTISRILANESIKPEIADILFENLEAIPTSDYMSQKIEEAKIQESDRRK
jgi:hypothetical protein